MPFVFVSHARHDKPRVRPVVDALIERGHKVWLDDPLAMNYAPEEVRAHFYRLHADKSWLEEIDEALVVAPVVVVCFSRHFSEKSRHTWHDEAARARQDGKLIPCRVDDFAIDDIPKNYHFRQMPDVSQERPASQRTGAISLLMDDVERKLKERSMGSLALRTAVKRDEFMPYLVDRTDHEEAIGEALAEVGRDGGVRPFFVAGPENECLDEFIQRLERRTCAERLGSGRSWLRRHVEWPQPDARPDFLTAYRRRIARELGPGTEGTEVGIASALAAKGRPVAVISLLVPSEWHHDETDRIAQWLTFWARLARAPQRFAVLPLLCLKMPPAPPGWTDAPSGTADGAMLSNAQIYSAVRRLTRPPSRLATLFAKPPERAALGCLPLLHPVGKGHAERWLMNDAIAAELGHDAPKAKSAISALFEPKPAARHGVSLSDFAMGLMPLFRSGS